MRVTISCRYALSPVAGRCFWFPVLCSVAWLTFTLAYDTAPSCTFHPSDLLLHFPLLHFYPCHPLPNFPLPVTAAYSTPAFLPYRIFHSRIFSRSTRYTRHGVDSRREVHWRRCRTILNQTAAWSYNRIDRFKVWRSYRSFAVSEKCQYITYSLCYISSIHNISSKTVHMFGVLLSPVTEIAKHRQ